MKNINVTDFDHLFVPRKEQHNLDKMRQAEYIYLFLQ